MSLCIRYLGFLALLSLGPACQKNTSLPSPKASSGLSVYALSDGIKVGPTGEPLLPSDIPGDFRYSVAYPQFRDKNPVWDRASRTVSLFGARGETVAFQIIVEGKSGTPAVRVLPEDLIGPGIATISAKQISLFREGFLRLTHTRRNTPGEYPDPLFPADSPRGLPADINGIGAIGVDPQRKSRALPHLTGVYQGDTFKELTIEVEKGGALGEATLRVSTDGGKHWQRSGITASEKPTPLLDGVEISFTPPRKGDVLVSGERFLVTLYPHQALPIWVDLAIPKDAAPGNYQGKIEILSGKGDKIPLTLSLRVYGFTLPDPSLTVFWRGYGDDIKGVEGVEGDPARAWEILREYYKMARAHGADFVLRDAYWHDDPDFARFDETFGTVLSGALFEDKKPVRLFEVPSGKTPTPGDRAQERDYLTRLKRFATHLRARGWVRDGVFVYPADEPEICDYRERLLPLLALTRRALGDDIPILLTEQPTPLDPVDDWYTPEEEANCGPDLWRMLHARRGEEDANFPGWQGRDDAKVDIWAPAARFFFPSTMPEIKAKGATTWFYQHDEPHAGGAYIERDALSFRTWPWIAYRYGVEGVFYWATTHYSDVTRRFTAPGAMYIDPVTYGKNANGDGTLFYPGGPIGAERPLPSIRMKAFRRGLYDYAYLEALAQHGQGELSRTIARQIIPRALNELDSKGRAPSIDYRGASSLPTWPRDPALFEKARQRMAEAIEKSRTP